MDGRKIAVGLMLAIPTIVLLALPLYNRTTPVLFGLPFFYWFQGLWLFIAAALYVAAALVLNRIDRE
ncbi:MAG: DUF3311 domain-containing protein [Conexivisphaerales archaeon]